MQLFYAGGLAEFLCMACLYHLVQHVTMFRYRVMLAFLVACHWCVLYIVFILYLVVVTLSIIVLYAKERTLMVYCCIAWMCSELGLCKGYLISVFAFCGYPILFKLIRKNACKILVS
jgi:hypothetical protein